MGSLTKTDTAPGELSDERAIEIAEADAAEAEALAAAARARAQAIRLRHVDQPSSAAGTDTEWEPPPADLDGRRRLRIPRPRWRTVAAAVALLSTAAVLAASGYIVWQRQHTLRDDGIRAEYAAAARQMVVTLMSIDFNKPNDSVQRIIDNSTGPFRDEFQGAADDFVKVAQDAKVTTNATVNAAAVESMTADSAVVLVTASSTVTNAAGAKDAPRSWRLAVDVRRDGDRIKMSKVEFVP